MNAVNAKVGLAGRYQLVVGNLDADGNEVPGSRHVAVPWFENLITDGGLDQLGSEAPYTDMLAYCRIGTGNTAPSNTDTGLVTQSGSTNTNGLGGGLWGVDGSGTFIYRRESRRFNPGVVAGVNLAEVAMAPLATGQVFSRSLIKDTGGSPTTITLAADEYLDVIYELRMYLPANDATTTATIDGVSTTVTIRYATKAQQLNNWAAWIGRSFTYLSLGDQQSYNNYYSRNDGLETLPAAATGWGYQTSDNYASVTTNPYSAGTYTKTFTLLFGPTVANHATGIGAVMLGVCDGTDGREKCSLGPWAFGFSTKLNKTITRKATVTVGVTWGRYSP